MGPAAAAAAADDDDGDDVHADASVAQSNQSLVVAEKFVTGREGCGLCCGTRPYSPLKYEIISRHRDTPHALTADKLTAASGSIRFLTHPTRLNYEYCCNIWYVAYLLPGTRYDTLRSMW